MLIYLVMINLLNQNMINFIEHNFFSLNNMYQEDIYEIYDFDMWNK